MPPRQGGTTATTATTAAAPRTGTDLTPDEAARSVERYHCPVKITHLEQQVIDLRLQLEERDEGLAAARATNRELMTQLNHAAVGSPRSR